MKLTNIWSGGSVDFWHSCCGGWSFDDDYEVSTNTNEVDNDKDEEKENEDNYDKEEEEVDNGKEEEVEKEDNDDKEEEEEDNDIRRRTTRTTTTRRSVVFPWRNVIQLKSHQTSPTSNGAPRAKIAAMSVSSF